MNKFIVRPFKEGKRQDLCSIYNTRLWPLDTQGLLKIFVTFVTLFLMSPQALAGCTGSKSASQRLSYDDQPPHQLLCYMYYMYIYYMACTCNEGSAAMISPLTMQTNSYAVYRCGKIQNQAWMCVGSSARLLLYSRAQCCSIAPQFTCTCIYSQYDMFAFFMSGYYTLECSDVQLCDQPPLDMHPGTVLQSARLGTVLDMHPGTRYWQQPSFRNQEEEDGKGKGRRSIEQERIQI